ncbi:hypothetical protein GCM10025773_33080 [Microbacterium jejuense]
MDPVAQLVAQLRVGIDIIRGPRRRFRPPSDREIVANRRCSVPGFRGIASSLRSSLFHGPGTAHRLPAEFADVGVGRGVSTNELGDGIELGQLRRHRREQFPHEIRGATL